MPINSYNVGRDVAVDIFLPSGPVRFSNITSFDSKERTKQIESHGIDGISRFQEIPNGWDGTIEIDRADTQVDNAIGALESLYYTGQNVPASTITQTITEVGGFQTQWRYEGVMFKLEDAGSWKGDSKVTQKLGFVASFRKKVL